jgi:hypothetical protein
MTPMTGTRAKLRTGRYNAAELRAKAAWCFLLAAKMPRGFEAEQVKTFGHEYLKMAEQLEALRDELPKSRRPGRA